MLFDVTRMCHLGCRAWHLTLGRFVLISEERDGFHCLDKADVRIKSILSWSCLLFPLCRSAQKSGQITSQALQETLRYGLFVGTFAGGYCSVDSIIGAIWGPKRYSTDDICSQDEECEVHRSVSLC